MKEYKKDDHDFLEIGAKYTKGYEGPENYGGFSGGGLWHVLIERSRNGAVEIKDRILSGVAFYQEPIVDSIRIIRCNGRQSIYKKVIEKIRNEFF